MQQVEDKRGYNLKGRDMSLAGPSLGAFGQHTPGCPAIRGEHKQHTWIDGSKISNKVGIIWMAQLCDQHN